MNQVIENFLERPKSHKIAFWLGSLLVIFYVFWQFSYSGAVEENSMLEQKVDDLQKKISDERRRAANLSKLREAVKDLDQKLKMALQELPDKREIPDLVDSISTLARDAGLEVTLFRPNEEVLRDFYAEVPVSISVDGTFHQVATFFDEVGQLPRIVNINQISIHDPSKSESKVNVKVDCVATTFRYLDEAERAKVAADKNAKKSGGKRRK